MRTKTKVEVTNMNTTNNAQVGDSSSTPRPARIPRDPPTIKFWEQYAAEIETHLEALRVVGDRLSDLAVFHEARAITNDDVMCRVTVQAHLDFEKGFALLKACKGSLQREASMWTIPRSPLMVAGRKLDSCVNELKEALLEGLNEDESKQVAEYLDGIGKCSLMAIQTKLEILKNKES